MNQQRLEIAEKAGDSTALIGIHTTAGYILAESGNLDEVAKHFEKADQLRDDSSLSATVRENRRFGKMQNHARLLIARQEFDQAKTQLEEISQYLSSRKN